MANNEKVRVLHILGMMNRGGVETWLMHVLRNIDRDQYQFDFLVHTTQQAAYDDEIRALGSRIIPCPRPSMNPHYSKELMRILRDHGPYDVVHSHIHHFSGVTLGIAKLLGVPMRIAHSHSDRSSVERDVSLARKLYLRLTEKAVHRFATHKLAVSGPAARSLYGDHWKSDDRAQILLYGIDLSEYEFVEDHSHLRRELGIPEGTWVVGHVGRFVAVKNHDCIVNLATKLSEQTSSICFLLVGDGELRPRIERIVGERDLERVIFFAGVRDDVPQLMMHAMDMFILPSHYEGLGLVGIEAQAAGLPGIYSDTIPGELEVVSELVEFLPLESMDRWVARIKQLQNQKRSLPRGQALKHVQASPFGIETCVSELSSLYSGVALYDT